MLRSLRFGEADRILHVYTSDRGRIGAIAKGIRRSRSRFGGRLEPFSHVALMLHEGRSDLMTITGADSIRPHARLRESGAAIDAAARACDAVGRLFETGEPHPEVFHLLLNELALLDADPSRADLANQLAFRMKLLLAAGLAPQLGACATCGEHEHLSGFSGAAGGVVCSSCEAGRSRWARRPTGSWWERSDGRSPRRPRRPSGRCARPTGRSPQPWNTHAHLRLRPRPPGRLEAVSDSKWVYDFSEGSREMRDLLGGKGATSRR